MLRASGIHQAQQVVRQLEKPRAQPAARAALFPLELFAGVLHTIRVLRILGKIIGVCFLTVTLQTPVAYAFSLLGPYEPWMQSTNGFRQPGDIGGPMNLGAEYRWNVPVLTYSFDQSFLDYFGSNGVFAVEQAIQILNDLPPASQLDPATYPPESTRWNYAAQALGLTDVKSKTLATLLEQLGLTQPTRHAAQATALALVPDDAVGPSPRSNTRATTRPLDSSIAHCRLTPAVHGSPAPVGMA